ncbi:MAG: hypothetical protein MUC58_11420 [Rhizobiaceae bacterium]|jgi:hypothetical protein|nr:hypothetical protein [Rhizobiaceae bacterium]
MANAHRLTVVATLAAGTLFGSGMALAETQGRYVLERTQSGIIRMDTQTGAISTCTEQTGELICRMAADDRDAYEADIAALEKRIAALEAKAGVPATDNAPATEQEFNTAMDRMEGFFRRFMGIVKEFQGEFGQAPVEPEPQPDRT